MTCQEAILSEQTYDYVTDFPVEGIPGIEGLQCSIAVNDQFQILYVDNGYLPSLENNILEYQGIPKLYGLTQIGGDESLHPKEREQSAPQSDAMTDAVRQSAPQSDQAFGVRQPEPFDPAALIASGIAQVQGPPLNLTGFGTLICIIDTGIDYQNPLFLDELGNTRILSVWDQTVQTGTPPEGFFYGSEYTRERINLALRSEDPREIVPSVDEVGHGTALASVAAGSLAGATTSTNPSRLVPPGFQGAAPEAGLVIVKCKPAKTYLRDYYLLPEDALAYQENDVMLAVKYCESFARLFERPVVICLGIGTSVGNHNGSSPLSRYLDQIAVKRNRVVVVSGGNEGNSAGHFRGDTPEAEVEIRVADGNKGFYMELWGRRTNVINVEIRSPGGEVIPPIPLGLRQSITFSFVYERTRVTIYSTLVEPSSGDELISFRFVDPTPGIWIFRITGRSDVKDSTYDLWLPLVQFQHSPVYFLSPFPDITMTEPAMASSVISVSAYQPANNSFYIESGRGFTWDGLPKPDLSAPGVNISTAYGKQSGSGFAAALTAGAASQLLQWCVVEGNAILAESRTIKGYLIRGARRDGDVTYPNKEWGYGRLDMLGTFTSLRS